MITSSEKERGIERASKESKAPLHLMSYRGTERKLLHTHTHTVRAKIFCIEYSAQRKTIENHLSNILYCLLQPFSIDRIQLFILEHATAKATIVFVFALKTESFHTDSSIFVLLLLLFIFLYVYLFICFLFFENHKLYRLRLTWPETRNNNRNGARAFA